ncbi:DUF4190 domain-containing protein [Nesterenkonia alba]|uniref:DUF4190 domain-containing protein n=1 Tax=Nesterenkonia alba TaxID=515814 RepID=UPI0003B3D69C|nr:DUF4190 domain-containing protein [Nesterenkonia alba]
MSEYPSQRPEDRDRAANPGESASSYPSAPHSPDQAPSPDHAGPGSYPSQNPSGYNQAGQQQGYPPQHPGAGQYPPQGQHQQPYPVYSYSPPGQGNATTGMVLGIIGLVNAVFISLFLWITGPLSIVLGWIAVHQGNKASRLGANGMAGQVMGWISIALGGLWLLGLLGFLIFFVWIFSEATTHQGF